MICSCIVSFGIFNTYAGFGWAGPTIANITEEMSLTTYQEAFVGRKILKILCIVDF